MRHVRCVLGGLAAVVALAGTAAGQNPFPAINDGVVMQPQPRVGAVTVLADVDGDGDLDALVADAFGASPALPEPTINVMLNVGGPQVFGPNVQHFPQTDGEEVIFIALAAGDLNGDGRADVATTYLSRFFSPAGNRPNIAVLFGQPNGTLGGQVNLRNSWTDTYMTSMSEFNMAIGDVTGDGINDIVSPTAQQISVLPGNGDGTFGEPILSGGGNRTFTLLGDIDGDGDQDVVGIFNAGSDSNPHLDASPNINDGTGRFTRLASTTLTTTRTNIVYDGQARCYLRDVTGDGKADLIAFGEQGTQVAGGGIHVRRSEGNGVFTQIFRETRGQDQMRTATLSVADVDGDGDIDLVKVPNGTATGEVLMNDGSGAFPVRVPFTRDGYYRGSGEMGDVAGNGLPDLVVYDQTFGNVDPTRLRVAVNALAGAGCYANCDGSTASPVLNVADFTCFLQRFAAGESYANCDGSTSAPVLNVADFTCFLQGFAAGCP